MRDLLNLIRSMLLGLFRSKTSLEAEILALRHQLNVLRRASPRRPVFSNFDRMIFVCFSAKATSVARLENVPPQPCRRDRLNRPLRGSDDLIQVTVRPSNSST